LSIKTGDNQLDIDGGLTSKESWTSRRVTDNIKVSSVGEYIKKKIVDNGGKVSLKVKSIYKALDIWQYVQRPKELRFILEHEQKK
jgi:hypothetical protein